jgi:hypothetical protein
MIKYRPMSMQSWSIKFDDEITQAEAARAAGNEGKARVCARRAAGIVIGEYLERSGNPLLNASAYDRLRYLQNSSNLPEPVREIISHFLVRIDTDHNLPVDADLITEAKWLAETLLHPNGESHGRYE